MNKILIPLVALAAFSPAFAETKEQLSEKLLAASGAQAQYEEVSATATRNMFKQMSEAPGMPPEMKEKMQRAGKRVAELMKTEMGWDKMKPEMIRLQSETYTADEMTAAIAFYETPMGKAFAAKSGTVSAKGSEIGMKLSAALGTKIQAIVMEEIQGASTGNSSQAGRTKSSLIGVRNNAIEKTVINDARQISSAAAQHMCEQASTSAKVGDLIGENKFVTSLSKGVKIAAFDPKKPGEIVAFDPMSKEGKALVLKQGGAFALVHENLKPSDATSEKLKDNAASSAGAFAFSVDAAEPVKR